MGRWTHGAVLGVVIAEDGESPALPEMGSLPQGVIVHRRRHDDGGRVRGAGGEIPVHIAQPPPARLGEIGGEGGAAVGATLAAGAPVGSPERVGGVGSALSSAGCLPSRLTCEAICWKYCSRGKRCHPSSSFRLWGL